MLKYGVYYQDKNSLKLFLFSRFKSKEDAEDMAHTISHRPYVAKAFVVSQEPKENTISPAWTIVAVVVGIAVVAFVITKIYLGG